jgi:ribose transport system substrate-binding protein
MKLKFLTAAAAVATGLLLVACGSSSSSKSKTVASNKSTNYRITFIPGGKIYPFYTSMYCGVQAEAKSLGNVTVNEQGANEFNPTQQIPVVNAVTAAKPDAVLMAPTDESALIPPMTQMKEQGIKIVQVDTKVSDSSVAVSQVSSNNLQGGELAARELAKQIHGKVAVMAISSEPGVSTDDLRKQGFEKEIKKYPNIEYVGVQYDKSSPSTATSEVNAVLSAHPNLAGVFGTDFTGVEGAYAAAKAAGKSGVLKVIGYDADAETLKAIKEGTLYGVVSQDPFEEGVLGVKYAVAALKGESPPTKTLLEAAFITKANANSSSMSKFIYKESC